MIEITDNISIDEEKLWFKLSRSSGPGGQNVNKVSTRVTVFFDLAGSQAFSDVQKRRIFKKLANRIDKHGVVRVSSQKFRTQKANRRKAIERLCELLAEALQRKKSRRKTWTPRHAVEKRLQDKKQRSLLKQQRSAVHPGIQ